MFRKYVLAAVLSVTALTGVASAADLRDRDRDFRDRERRDHDHDRDYHHRRYEVLVQHRFHWDVHGVYRDRFDAERAAQRLRYQGYRVQIRVR